MIGIKAWYVNIAIILARHKMILIKLLLRRHRRDIRSHLAKGSRKSAAQGILVLLVESGLLYCTIWVRRLDFSSTFNQTYLREIQALFIVSVLFNKGSLTAEWPHALSSAIPPLVVSMNHFLFTNAR